MLAFYHKKGIVIFELGRTLPNLTSNCLHKYTSAKFYPFTETDKDFLQRVQEIMVAGPSIVLTRKAVVDETFSQNSGNFCQSIVGLDGSQLYPHSMCQPMKTGPYTRWDYETESNNFKPQQNKSRNFENKAMSYLQKNLTVKLRVSKPQEHRKKLIVSRPIVFGHIVLLCLRL